MSLFHKSYWEWSVLAVPRIQWYPVRRDRPSQIVRDVTIRSYDVSSFRIEEELHRFVFESFTKIGHNNKFLFYEVEHKIKKYVNNEISVDKCVSWVRN